MSSLFTRVEVRWLLLAEKKKDNRSDDNRLSPGLIAAAAKSLDQYAAR